MEQERLIFAVSGGVDSSYLLHTLVSAGYTGVVCHVNHGLRAEADQDATFVRSLATSYALPYEEVTLDLSGQGSIETRARQARLEFFSQMSKRHKISRVALAHHLDDQAETVLMQLCRGSHTLPGMRQLSHMPELGLELWRPLLNTRKADIITWMNDNGHSWREDHTNSQGIAVRNRLRAEALPLLNDIFSRDVTPTIARGKHSDSSQHIAELIAALNVTDPQGRLFLPKIANLSPSLQQLILKQFLESQGITNLSTAKLTEATTIISNPETWKINLPNNKFLRRKAQRIFIDPTPDSTSSISM